MEETSRCIAAKIWFTIIVTKHSDNAKHILLHLGQIVRSREILVYWQENNKHDKLVNILLCEKKGTSADEEYRNDN